MISQLKRLFTCWLIIISSGAAGQNVKFPPRDESSSNADLQSFVEELKVIIKNKDGQRLMELVHPDVKLDFDDGVGIDKFRMQWKPEEKKSELWTVMGRIVGLGGIYNKNRTNPFFDFVFPYVNQVELEADQYFKTLVITGENVPMHERPDAGSKTKALLTHDVVTFNYEKSSDSHWYFIETSDMKFAGYVRSDSAYSPVDYRMFLTKENGRWMISCLIAGD